MSNNGGHFYTCTLKMLFSFGIPLAWIAYCIWFNVWIPYFVGVLILYIIACFNNELLAIELQEHSGFKLRLEHASEMAIHPDTTRVVGMRYNHLGYYGLGLHQKTLDINWRTPDTYLAKLAHAIQKAQVVPNNRSLAKLIAEYAVEMHCVFLYNDLQKTGVLYYGLDCSHANSLCPPSEFPEDPHCQTSPVYWNAKAHWMERTCWYASIANEQPRRWLMHVSAPLNPNYRDESRLSFLEM
jgi:hypothetical protein